MIVFLSFSTSLMNEVSCLSAPGPGRVPFVLLAQTCPCNTFGHLSPAEEHALYFQIPFTMQQFRNPIQKKNTGDYQYMELQLKMNFGLIIWPRA